MKLLSIIKHNMRNEIKKYHGFTLIELMLATIIVVWVAGAMVGIIYNSFRNWRLGGERSTLLQDGRASIEQMTRIIRQAKGFNSVSVSTDDAGQITFVDSEGEIKQFRRNALTNEIEYGSPDSQEALTGSVSGLAFTCYDANTDELTAPVKIRKVRAIGIEATMTEAAGDVEFTLSDKVFCMEDFQNEIVINEIMYNPTGQQNDGAIEWVELHNWSDSAVDVGGWSIWTGAENTADPLTAHPLFGNGLTTIPAKGYAVITAAETDVYTELITNGGFEAADISAWIINPGSSWLRTSGGAHGGTRKLESTTAGATSVYQQITIPSGFNSCMFIFWEKTTAAVGQTQMTATIRNTSDVILATGYSGQFHSDWTCHTLDIEAFAGQTVRIYFAANNSAGSGALMLDDVSAAVSYVDAEAVRLGVDDSKIGGGLDNSDDTAAIVNGSDAIADSVSYINTWGGNGDGTSLSRIDPEGASNDQSNWTSGPLHGTPGGAN